MRIKIKDLLDRNTVEQIQEVGLPVCTNSITIRGWVRTKRGSKNVSFIAVNDGSTIHNLQVVVDNANFDVDVLKRITTGACVSVIGVVVESQASGQHIELTAQDIVVLGEAPVETYPLQPKKHSLEFLREIGHLRPRTNYFSAVLRVRNAAAFAIHEYFNQNGFVWLHTPIITGSDAEGAGEMFSVTHLDMDDIPHTPDGEIDYTKDFFGKKTHLTVSGQLEAEIGAWHWVKSTLLALLLEPKIRIPLDIFLSSGWLNLKLPLMIWSIIWIWPKIFLRQLFQLFLKSVMMIFLFYISVLLMRKKVNPHLKGRICL